jgi:DNA-binding IclR family transcriptional regulator
MFGIAAPIRDYSRQVVAALGITLPIRIHSPTAELDRMVDLVKRTCETISSSLGYLRV